MHKNTGALEPRDDLGEEHTGNLGIEKNIKFIVSYCYLKNCTVLIFKDTIAYDLHMNLSNTMLMSTYYFIVQSQTHLVQWKFQTLAEATEGWGL